MEITAKIIKENVEGINHTHREREEKNGLHHGYKAITILDGKPVDLVDLRIAFTPNGTPYVCVWLHRPAARANGKIIQDGMWSHGSGTAGGYGYHKASAATDIALKRAGVELSYSIHGLGDSAIRDAILATGKALCPGGPVYVVEMYA